MSASEEQIQASARAMCGLNAIRQGLRIEFDKIDIREREYWEDLARVCLIVGLSRSSDSTAAALQECVSILELVERPAFVDPDYGDEVAALGNRIGYGALMSSASASWRERLEEEGCPTGGEFVAGPCYATVVSLLNLAREALVVSSTHSNTVAEPSRCKNPVARGESKEADASTGDAPVASASTLSVTSTDRGGK